MTVPLVIGLGRDDRGDDALGLEVARAVASRGDSDVEVVEADQPTDLIGIWSGRERVVVVDAVVSGAPPGTIHRLQLGADRGAGTLPGWPSRHGGTHAFGIDAVVGLAAALGRLPPTLVLVGVEASSFDQGAALSPPVAGALEAVVAEVLAQVGDAAR